jgi:hypothetical protein
MTFVLNQWFYIAVVLVVIVTTVSLPAKRPSVAAGSTDKPSSSAAR